MAGFVGVLVSDPWLQNQFTQVELRSLKSKFTSMKDHGSSKADGGLKLRDLASAMSGLKIVGDGLTEDERDCFIRESHSNLDDAVDFELFLRVYLKMQGRIGAKSSSSAFLKAATTTLLHTISESEKASYVNHINNYLGEDAFLKKDK
ncbi:fimbrin-2-like [Ananas comosus]|uniref:Fimbrin-2-like n=1 Tax=Ananas comosus TaxID=4615 RepID=A0A6P5H0S2_ANACO|nr:fimbrin-2-like [Ananas comosus]